MKIVHTESHMDWGGQEIGTFREARYLLDHGHGVLVICQPGSGLERYCRQKSVPVNAIPWMRRAVLSPLFILHALYLLSRIRPDLVHCHGSKDHWIYGLAARILGIPVVRTKHNSVPLRPIAAVRFLYKRLADRCIARGQGVRLQLIRDAGCDPARVVSIAVGADPSPILDREASRRLREELGVGDRRMITCVAALQGYKGQRNLLRAFASIRIHFPDSVLVLVGEGPELENLRRLAGEMDLAGQVVFTGFREDVPGILSVSSLYVLPSTSVEGTPQVIPQAWAAGLPVVASRLEGVTDMVEHGRNGLLVDPGDVRQLAQAMDRLLADGGLAKRLADEGRRSLEGGLRSADTFSRTMDLYRELLAEKRQG